MMDLAKNIIKDITKKEPIMLKRMGLGFVNNVYSVKLLNKNLIIRMNSNGEYFENYKHNLEVLKTIEIPTPKLVYMDTSKRIYPYAYMIFEQILGKDLRYEIEYMSKDEMTNVARSVVDYQKKVMNLPMGKGFGRTVFGGNAEYKNWNDFIKNNLEIFVEETKEVVKIDYINRIYNLMNSFKEYFYKVKPIPFMDDISLKNVIIHNKKLKAFIDFDWICYGDPIYTIGLVQTGIILHLEDKCMHYVEELCRFMNISEYERKVINFYSIICTLEFISFQIKMKNWKTIENLIYRIEFLLKDFE